MREHGGENPQQRYARNSEEHVADEQRQIIREEHDASAAQDKDDHRQVVEDVVDHERLHAVNERHALSQERHLGRFAQQRPRESEKADRFAAETDGKRLKEVEAAMLRRDGAAHGERAQDMTRAVDRNQNKENETDATEGIEDGLHADAVDDVDQQPEAQQEGYRL